MILDYTNIKVIQDMPSVLAVLYARLFSGISYEYDRSRSLKNEPVIFLPNHQSILDIGLENRIIHKAIGETAYFVMKGSLGKFFELGGGISINRGKEIKKSEGFERKEKLKLAQDRINHVYSTVLPNIFSKDGKVVIYIQGERQPLTNYNLSSKLAQKRLKGLINISKQVYDTSGKYVSFVPIDINYDQFKESKHIFQNAYIFVTMGKPVKTISVDELTNHLADNIYSFKINK